MYPKAHKIAPLNPQNLGLRAGGVLNKKQVLTKGVKHDPRKHPKNERI